MTLSKLTYLLFGSFYERSFNEEKKQVVCSILRHIAFHKPCYQDMNVALGHVYK